MSIHPFTLQIIQQFIEHVDLNLVWDDVYWMKVLVALFKQFSELSQLLLDLFWLGSVHAESLKVFFFCDVGFVEISVHVNEVWTCK